MATRRIAPREIPRPFGTDVLDHLADDELLDRLLVEHHAKAAFWLLWSRASDDSAGVRRGLRHPDASVRATCCRILDHFLDDDALADVVASLDDPHAEVRAWALHTLGCDRCKEGTCRPGGDVVVGAALRLVVVDPEPRVRRVAAEVLGRLARSGDRRVLSALVRCRDGDPDRLVRETAARFLARHRSAA